MLSHYVSLTATGVSVCAAGSAGARTHLTTGATELHCRCCKNSSSFSTVSYCDMLWHSRICNPSKGMVISSASSLPSASCRLLKFADGCISCASPEGFKPLFFVSRTVGFCCCCCMCCKFCSQPTRIASLRVDCLSTQGCA